MGRKDPMRTGEKFGDIMKEEGTKTEAILKNREKEEGLGANGRRRLAGNKTQKKTN